MFKIVGSLEFDPISFKTKKRERQFVGGILSKVTDQFKRRICCI